MADLPLIVVCSRAASRTSVQALEAAGVDVIVATGENEAARVEHALDELGAREIQSLLLEGGPHLAGAFLEAGEIDEARMFIAPLMIGGATAKTAVEGIGVGEIAAGSRALAIETERIEDDVLDHRALQGVVRCSPGWWPARGWSAALAHGRVEVETALAGELEPGDSIAVNGVCLTAIERDNGSFAAEVMPETLRRTSLAPLAEGDEVNLELPLRAGDRLGGHMVQGHVDGTGHGRVGDRGGQLARRADRGARRSCSATWSRRDPSPWTACPLPFRGWTTGLRGVADPRDARAHDAGRRRARAGRSTWRSTSSPSTWRS